MTGLASVMKHLKLVVVLSMTIGSAYAAQPDFLVLQGDSTGDQWLVVNNDPIMPGNGNIDQTGFYGNQGPGEIPHLADINGDGLDDMVQVWEGPGFWRYGARYTEPNGTLGSGSPVESANFDLTTDTIFFGDLDQDNIDDVIGVRNNGSSLEWFARIGGTGGFAETAVISSGWGSATDIPLVGDINGDGLVDRLLSRVNGGGYELFVDYSTAPGSWGDGGADGGSWAGGDNSTDFLALTDINGDGRDDVMLVRDAGGDGVGAWEFFGYFTGPGGLASGSPDVSFVKGDVALHTPVFGNLTVIPEPTSFCLLCIAGGSLLANRRCRTLKVDR